MDTEEDNANGNPCKASSYAGEICPAIASVHKPTVTAESEPRLSMRSKNEDRIALTQIFERHRRGLLLAAFRITRNQDEAEEVVQEAAIKALLKLDTFRGESRLDTWIYAIVSNCAISRLRSLARRRWISLDSEVTTDQSSPRWTALETKMDPERECSAEELREIVCSEMEALKSPISDCHPIV